MSAAASSTTQMSLLAVQGADPVKDTGLGFAVLRHIGFQFDVLPQPVRKSVSRIFADILVDPERDTIFVQLILKWTLLYLPLWLTLLLRLDYREHPIVWGTLWLVHFALWSDSGETYVLGLHCLVHRRIFKSPYSEPIKNFYTWGLGPLFGVAPEVYYCHHIGMHHPTNNGFEDLSTTMTYRRDSLRDFAAYYLRFHFVHYPLYNALRSLNPKLQKRMVCGELLWLLTGLTILYFRPLPAVVLWFLPLLLARSGMVCGNWGQHAFINDADPFSNYNQSCVIVNSEYNTKAFNDGYHIMHHIHPSAHYTDLPKLFAADLPNLAKNDSIVFTSKQATDVQNWQSVWFLLMRGRYDVLADHFVDMKALVGGGQPRSKAQVIELLRSRTRKVYVPPA